MNAEIKDLTEWRHKAKRSMRDLNDDIDVKKAVIRGLDTDLRHARRKYDESLQDNEALRDRIAKKVKLLKELDSEMTQARGVIQDLRDQLKEEKQRIQDIDDALEELEKEHGMNVKQLIKSKIAEKFAKRILAKEGDMLLAQRDDIVAKEVEINEKAALLLDLDERLAAMKDEYRRVKADLEGEIGEAMAKIKGLKSKIVNMDEEHKEKVKQFEEVIREKDDILQSAAKKLEDATAEKERMLEIIEEKGLKIADMVDAQIQCMLGGPIVRGGRSSH